jgi:hypothetical protein
VTSQVADSHCGSACRSFSSLEFGDLYGIWFILSNKMQQMSVSRPIPTIAATMMNVRSGLRAVIALDTRPAID